MNRVLSLTLSSPIYYLPVSESFDSLTGRLYKEKRGYDFIIEYHFSFSDELFSLQQKRRGIPAHPHTLSKEEDPNPGISFSLSEGTYLFSQLVPLEKEEDIKRALLPFVGSKKEGVVFVRYFKETQFEIVMQFLMPLT